MFESDSIIDLVKVYLKTLCGPLVILPHTRARPWGYEFTLEEYEAIYLGLKTLLLSNSTHIDPDEQLWIEFEKLSRNRQVLHWFIYQFVEQLVALINERETRLRTDFWGTPGYHNLN